jgi:hypothetical protein
LDKREGGGDRVPTRIPCSDSRCARRACIRARRAQHEQQRLMATDVNGICEVCRSSHPQCDERRSRVVTGFEKTAAILGHPVHTPAVGRKNSSRTERL